MLLFSISNLHQNRGSEGLQLRKKLPESLFSYSRLLCITSNHLWISGCSHDHRRVHNNPQQTAYYRWHVSLRFCVRRSRARFSECMASFSPVFPRDRKLKSTYHLDNQMRLKVFTIDTSGVVLRT